MNIIERITHREMQKICLILGKYLPAPMDTLAVLIRKFGSFDIALRVIDLATANGKDPLAYSLDNALSEIMDKELSNLKDSGY